LNPDVQATSIVAEIADVGLSELRRADVVFGCLDSELARLELGWAALRADRPLADGGLSVTAPSNGMVALYPGARGPCYLCRAAPERRRALLWELQGREDPCWVRERLAEQADAVSTTPLISAVVAALQVEIGLRFAAGEEPAPTGVAHRISLHPSPFIENRVFTLSESCPMHGADDVLDGVAVREGRSSAAWRVADLLHEVADGPGQAALLLDWPITVRARCESCRHEWEPMMRRARFRRSTCPACGADAVVECESVAEIEAASPWATRTLSSLGLPSAHVHSVVHRKPDGVRRHFVVPGDDVATLHGSGWP
jgi:adenylyltransferase/sulfurtransferase